MVSDTNSKVVGLVTVSIIAFLLSACAALQPTSPNGPTSNRAPYPVVVNDSSRQESSTLAWQQLSQRYGLPQNTAADLNPLLGTIHSLPANSTGAIYLPKV